MTEHTKKQYPQFIDSDKVNICMAYLTYIGETIVQNSKTPKEILTEIQAAIPQINALTKNDEADWEIVWGPFIYTFGVCFAKYQDNGMFVARQKSDPQKYVVAIRGTNGKAILDWLFEDFNVFHLNYWDGQEALNAKISEATQTGFSILKKAHSCGPKFGQADNISLENFFKRQLNNGPIHITFTGHSLGGALAPTLALYFQERQLQWKTKYKATISCTAFAGATAGNAQFAKYSNKMFGDKNAIRRIHNCYDIVPHAWDKNGLEKIKTIYTKENTDGKVNIKLNWKLRLLLWFFIVRTAYHHYTQINESIGFKWTIDPAPFPAGKSSSKKNRGAFLTKAFEQHVRSYPEAILGTEQGQKLQEVITPKPKKGS